VSRKLRVRKIELVTFRDGTNMVKMTFKDGSVAWITPQRLENVMKKEASNNNIIEKLEEINQNILGLGNDIRGLDSSKHFEDLSSKLDRLNEKLTELVEENRKLREAITDLVNVLLKVKA